MEWTLRSIGTLGLAGVLALVPLRGLADSDGAAAAAGQPFLITTTTQTAGGTLTFRDVLIVRGDAGIAGDAATVERARSCYAIAAHVLAAGSPRKPYAIGVALDDVHALAVPMRASISQPGDGARLVQAAGDAAGELVTATDRVSVGVHVDARVLAHDGRLEAATFRTLTYLTAPPMRPVEVSGCSVQRLPQAPPASAEPPAGAQSPASATAPISPV